MIHILIELYKCFFIYKVSYSNNAFPVTLTIINVKGSPEENQTLLKKTDVRRSYNTRQVMLKLMINPCYLSGEVSLAFPPPSPQGSSPWWLYLSW